MLPSPSPASACAPRCWPAAECPVGQLPTPDLGAAAQARSMLNVSAVGFANASATFSYGRERLPGYRGWCYINVYFLFAAQLAEFVLKKLMVSSFK